MVAEPQTRIIDANGIRFEVLAAAPSSQPDRPATARKLALLLHGFPELNYSWRFQIPLFAAAGYTVWAPNLRGYGHTTRPHGTAAYRLDHLVADIAGLIDAAKAEGIADEICLVAHDWGAVIAWSLLLGKVRPVDRFIVTNLPHPTRFLQELRTWKQFKRSWYVLFFQIPWLPEKLLGARRADAIGKAFSNMAVDKSRFPDQVLDVYRTAACQPGALTAMLNYYRAGLRQRTRFHDLWRAPPLIDTPTLMIWGEEDTALSGATTDGTHALVADFTLRRLPGVSHWVQQEAPEAVNTMIRAWLAGDDVPQMTSAANRAVLPDPKPNSDGSAATSSAAR